MSQSTSAKALGNNRTLTAAKIVVAIIAVLMVIYMIPRSTMYPVWTIIMVGAVGLYTAFSLYKDFAG